MECGQELDLGNLDSRPRAPYRGGYVESTTEVHETQAGHEAPEQVWWMTYEQAARYCNVERTTLWRAVKRGALRQGGYGRAVRFERAELDRFMRSGGDEK